MANPFNDAAAERSNKRVIAAARSQAAARAQAAQSREHATEAEWKPLSFKAAQAQATALGCRLSRTLYDSEIKVTFPCGATYYCSDVDDALGTIRHELSRKPKAPTDDQLRIAAAAGRGAAQETAQAAPILPPLQLPYPHTVEALVRRGEGWAALVTQEGGLCVLYRTVAADGACYSGQYRLGYREGLRALLELVT